MIGANIEGREVNITYLHVKEWINCIRDGGIPTADIEKAYEEGITVLITQKAYLEGRQVHWDPDRQEKDCLEKRDYLNRLQI